MFLKSLTLNGFKAFADKTIFTFDEGIGGLIGPNGCGKSNVIDSFKWVIGEQKTSELRGNKMEDVIFHGSQDKPRANVAEVEMVISNENASLPVSFNEISITRRLYRSGESEYLINRKEARLKDIQNLFMDTGIGKSSYSVIEQGRIDKILSKNPEERRYIFEEAAGISKFNERKKEYQRKIERTGENLVRINDVIRELEKQHTQLSRQAENARKHFDLNDKLKNEEIGLLLYRLVQLRNDIKNTGEKVRRETDDVQKSTAELDETRRAIDDMSGIIKEHQGEINAFERKKIEIQEKTNSLRQQNSVFVERYSETEQLVQSTQQRVIDLKEEQKELQNRIQEGTRDLQEKQKQTEKNKTAIDSANEKVQILRKKLETHNNELASFRRKAQDNRKQINELSREHGQVIEQLVREIDTLKESLESSRTQDSENRRALLEYHKELRERAGELCSSKNEEDFHVELDRILGNSEIHNTVRRVMTAGFQVRQLVDQYAGLIRQHVSEKDPFYDLIFNTEGTYARKEKIDHELTRLSTEIELCETQSSFLEEEIKRCDNERSELQRSTAEIEIENAALEQSIEMLRRINDEKNRTAISLAQRVKEEERLLSSRRENLARQQEQSRGVARQLEELTVEQKQLEKNMAKFYSQISDQTRKLERLQTRAASLSEQSATRRKKIEESELHIKLLENDIKNLYENCENRFSEDLREYEKSIPNREFNPEQIRKSISSLKEQLSRIGSVNPIAQEEYNSIDERLKEMKSQRADITRSMDDLVKVADEIEEKSREMFITTFNKIRTNFHQLVRRLFNGGKAQLEIMNEKDVLRSGIEITVQPPGKALQSITLFSGGEKSMIAIALMLSIFLVKPSPVCLLDEVDAALDKNNINALAKILHEFQEKSQFIIISHNEKTFSVFDYVWGISMQDGITKAVSIKFDKAKAS